MIELRGVTLRAPGVADRPLLSRVDLDLAEGDVVVVSGPCGSGKSALLSLLYGGRLADGGSVRVFGHDVRRLRRSSIALLRRRVGIVPQHLSLLEDRTAAANVAVALEIRGWRPRDARVRAAEILAELGLAHAVDAFARDLSMGEAQRVAFARAVAGEPPLLLADEPTSHQDDEGRELLLSLMGENGAVIVTGDPALLDAARVRGWRHVELAGGRLEAPGVVSGQIDDAPHTDPDFDFDIEIDFTGDEDDDANVVPFPRRSVL